MEVLFKKNILITGIDGFTGHHLESYLEKKGYYVYGTVIDIPKKKNHFSCDLLDEYSFLKILKSVKPNYIINLAAISFVASKNKENIYKVNVFGALNVLSTIDKLDYVPEKIIMVSSAAVYGNIEGALREDLCPKPVNHYGNSKLVMENMIKAYFNRQNIIITRPFNYTGIGQKDFFLIPKIVSHYTKGLEEIELGNIDVFREFNDVDLIVESYEKLLISTIKSEIVNICSGNALNIKKVIALMDDLAGYKMKVVINPDFIRENEISILKGSPEKLNSFINLSNNKFSIEKTLIKMFEYKFW